MDKNLESESYFSAEEAYQQTLKGIEPKSQYSSICDHILDIDDKTGRKIKKKYNRPNDAEAILENLYDNTVKRFKFSDNYVNQVKNSIDSRIIEFGEYATAIKQACIYLLNRSNQKEPDKIDKIYKMGKIVNKKKKAYQYEFTYFFSENKIANMSNLVVNFASITINNDSSSRLKCYLKNIFKKIFFDSFSKFITSNLYLISIIIFVNLCLDFIINPSYSIWILGKLQNILPILAISKYAWVDYALLSLLILVSIFIAYLAIIYLPKLKGRLNTFLVDRVEKKHYVFEKQLPTDYTITTSNEVPRIYPDQDLFGFAVLAEYFYYWYIHDSFNWDINLISIIDAKRGMGKSVIINFLIDFMNGKSYRENSKKIKDINIVRLSIMPLFSLASSNYADEKHILLSKMLEYLAENLSVESAAIIQLMKFLNCIDTVTLPGAIVKLKKNMNDSKIQDAGKSLDELKNKIRMAESKHLIIIEDADRLNKNQLKVFIEFLWIIYELPLTITLIPAEKEKLYKSSNNRKEEINPENYLEPEEHKLFQKNREYSLGDYAYGMYASRYAISSRESEIFTINGLNNIWRKRYDKSIKLSEFNNWEKLVYKNNKFKNLVKSNKIIIQLNKSKTNLKTFVSETLCEIYKDLQISLRELKKFELDSLREQNIQFNKLFIGHYFILRSLNYRYNYSPQKNQSIYNPIIRKESLNSEIDKLQNLASYNKSVNRFVLHSFGLIGNYSFYYEKVYDAKNFIETIFVRHCFQYLNEAMFEQLGNEFMSEISVDWLNNSELRFSSHYFKDSVFVLLFNCLIKFEFLYTENYPNFIRRSIWNCGKLMSA